MSGFSLNRTWTIVPPLKSTPYSKPLLATSEMSPKSMTEPEMARNSFLLPSQSTLISLNSSIIRTYLYRHRGVSNCSHILPISLNTDRLDALLAIEHPFEQGPRYKNSSEHVRDESN